MSVALGLGLGLFVLLAVAGVLFVGLVSGYRNTVDLLRQKAALLVSSEANLAHQYLDAAERQVAFVAEQIVAGQVKPGPSEDFTSMMLGALAATRHILSIQYIGADYRLSGAEQGERQPTPIFLSVKGDDDLRRKVDAARERREPFWGALMWREEYRQPVLNYNRPIFIEGRFVGVVTALISVRALSEYLSDLNTDFGANAFILYGRDRVLVHPLMVFGYAGLTRMTPLPALNTFSDPVLASLWEERQETFLEERLVSSVGIRFVRLGRQAFMVLLDELKGYADRPLLIGTYLPSHDVLAEMRRLKWAAIVCVAIALLAAAVAAYIGRQIASPVRRLAVGARRIHDLDLASVERIPGSVFTELNDAAQSFNAMLDGLRWFERYVPKTLVKQLIRLHGSQGIEARSQPVAVMFTDIVGFTAISEQMTAPAVAAFLNEHFTVVADSIEGEGGTVDKYIGDSVMAVWGVPEPAEDIADCACRAALAIGSRIQAINDRRRERGEAPLRIRIGMHLGQVIVGNIGSPGRLNYTVIGDAVNVAQRINETGKCLGDPRSEVNILISAAVRTALTAPFATINLGRHPLRGRREEVEIYLLQSDGSGQPSADMIPAAFEI